MAQPRHPWGEPTAQIPSAQYPPQAPAYPAAAHGPPAAPQGPPPPGYPPPPSQPATPPHHYRPGVAAVGAGQGPSYGAGRGAGQPRDRTAYLVDPTTSWPGEANWPGEADWPGAAGEPAAPPRPPVRYQARQLRRGGELSAVGALFAFICWGTWAISERGGSLVAPVVAFVLVLLVAVGVFALCRLLGRLTLERHFGRVRRSAWPSHLITGLFLAAAGVQYLRQTEWIVDGISWLRGL